MTSHELHAALPLGNTVESVRRGRESVRAILSGADPRLLAVVGPCSVHNTSEALGYAERLAGLSEELGDRLLLTMRCYFEKPRTTIGWKGFLNDPHLDGSDDINSGLLASRKLLLGVAKMGLSAATEFLDPLLAPYNADLISVGAIGARTVESPQHRQLASALPMPVGFKNGTDGSVKTAIEAMIAASASHAFPMPDAHGRASIVRSAGNAETFLILRGGRNGPNYSAEALAAASAQLAQQDFASRLMVDCSHGNSAKNHLRQKDVLRDLLGQRRMGNINVVGVMLESYHYSGHQPFAPRERLKPGLSITDGCLGWDETEALLREAHASLGSADARRCAEPRLVLV